MADEAPRQEEKETEEPPRPAMADREATYTAFLNLIKWGVAVVALVLIGMAIFLV